MQQEEIEQAVEEVEKTDESATSLILPDKTLVEMVINEKGEEQFAVYKDSNLTYRKTVADKDSVYKPWSRRNPLISTGTIIFPEKAEEYGTNLELLNEIISYLKKYVELPSGFYTVAALYILMTWVYQRFSDVAYLRVTGIAGTGKTRFIKTVGLVAYKPMIASGSASTSVLFRIIDLLSGTFVFDEADFQSTDLWAEIIKILNSGHTKGMPVLRSQPTEKKGEFIPRPFRVFGPKVIASRMRFSDDALESRCLSEEMILKDKVNLPVYLAEDFEADAMMIRNKLLMFRFKNFYQVTPYQGEFIDRLDPRMRQTSLSVLSIATLIGDKGVIDELLKFLDEYAEEIRSERGNTEEADLLLVISKLFLDKRCNAADDPHNIVKSRGLKMSFIAQAFNSQFREDYDIKDDPNHGLIKNHLTPKRVGEIVRKKLKLKTKRQKWGFHIPISEIKKVEKLMGRYGFKFDDLKQVDCGQVHSKEVYLVKDVDEETAF